MGVEAAVGGMLIGSMVMGARQQKKAAKSAERAANDQANAINEQRGLARAEQDRINRTSDAAKKKLAAGMARSQRRRSKGGLFGDSAEVNTPAPAANLGG